MQPHTPHQPGKDEDFGIPAADAGELARRRAAEYAGRPAGSKPTGTGEGSPRRHGVGAIGGAGKGSGGDVDLELSGPEPPTADARGHTPQIGGGIEIAGSVQQRGDADSAGGAASVANGDQHDDAFAGEVSDDEASGRNDRP